MQNLPTILTDDEVKRLLGTFNKKTKTGFRNFVLLYTLFNTGMRISEALVCSYSDIAESVNQEGELVRYYVLEAKNSKTRIGKHIPIKDSIYNLMMELKSLYGHSKNDFVFTPVSRNKSTGKFTHLLSSYMRRIATKHGKLAKLPNSYNLHQSRHYFGSTVYQKSGDIFLVKEALFHKSINSSVIYTKITPEAVRKAANLIDLD